MSDGERTPAGLQIVRHDEPVKVISVYIGLTRSPHTRG
jgi:hypothetical protein